MKNIAITFKNGTQIFTTQQIVDKLRDQIISGKAEDFQCFSDPEGNHILTVRLSEIISIHKEF